MKQGVIQRGRQRGLSLVGFIFVLAIVALVAVVAMKVVPTVVEYSAVKNAIKAAKAAGSSPKEIRNAFDKQAGTTYIDSVTGSDLDILKTDDGFDVSVTYQKKIPLVGPASLVLDYAATTAKGGLAPKNPAQ